MFWKTKKFLQQQTKWYKKLQKSGFEDIEARSGSLNGARNLNNANLRREYFQALSDSFLKEKDISERDGYVIASLLFGSTQDQVAKELKINPHTVGFIRRRYESKWGIRHWKKNQLTSNRKKK